MKKGLFTILDNKALTQDVFRMVLEGDAGAIEKPGQFINIALDGFYLRRPISVCDWTENRVIIVYKVVGQGTAHMSRLAPGGVLDVLTGLGNGFDPSLAGEEPLLIGGGVGIPPLLGLAKRLTAAGVRPSVILGFQTISEVFCAEDFYLTGARVTVTTADGSLGREGLVTDALEGREPSFLYTCGPEAMLRAIYDKTSCGGQFSFEERMGCGFGACMGCSCETKYGYKRICKEGPVLERGEILW